MKTKIYLKVAKSIRKGMLYKASSKPDYSPIESAKYYNKRGVFLPTVAFAIEIDIPDESFKRAEKVVAQLNLKENDVEINVVKGDL